MPTGGTAALTGFLVRAGDEGPVTTPRVPAREAAERELSKPMYQEHEPGLFQRALDWFWERVDGLLGAASGATPGGTVGVVVIAAVVVLLVIALRLRLGALRRAPTTGGTLFDDRPRSAAEHRAAAERHASENRWEQAVQERMRAVVRSLEERALLDPRPGRTADEAAAEAGRSLPERADALKAAARAFDDVTYGGREATADAYARIVELDTDLQRSKPRLHNTPAGGAR
ncbi:DUF4129 domain-containing protein [Streptomyces sp. NPDC048639]|uniref:DUF4129 domain-containing protein n=1 Tax=Streptomyces sp. NPDC048639 TaxID=3365581 RepID=UPI003723CAF8